MSTKLTTSFLALPLLFLAAMSCLHVLGIRNGLVQMIFDNLLSSPPVLPGSDIPLRTHWTGLGLLDLDFSIMVTVFSSILNHHNLSLFIQGNHFFGFWMTSWILILLESHNNGPRSKTTSWPYKYSYVLWGLVMEFAGVAVGLPAWCAFSLLRMSRASSSAEFTTITLADLESLPFAFLLGAGLPTLLMLVGTWGPELPLWSRQTWIVVRLFHPVLVAMAHALLRSIGPAPPADGRQQLERRMKRLGRLYSVAFWITASSHILTVLAVLFAYLFPHVLPAHIVSSLSLASLWPVPSIWRGFVTKTDTIALGTSTFMTANEVISTISLLVWAWNMNRMALQSSSHKDHLGLSTVKAGVFALVFGPGAAAVALIENRDHVLHQRFTVTKGAKAC
ncbi:hypothetical protein MANI_010560 [Metarhizium anisopliae]